MARRKQKRGGDVTREMLARGLDAQDHRASRARAYEREQAGEQVEVCDGCGCETDVLFPVHQALCTSAARSTLTTDRGGRGHPQIGGDGSDATDDDTEPASGRPDTIP